MQISDSFVLSLLFVFHLDSFLVQFLNSLFKTVDHVILDGIALILITQLVNKLLELFFFLFHIDVIAFQIVMLLTLENFVKLVIKSIDYKLKLFLLFSYACSLFLLLVSEWSLT